MRLRATGSGMGGIQLCGQGFAKPVGFLTEQPDGDMHVAAGDLDRVADLLIRRLRAGEPLAAIASHLRRLSGPSRMIWHRERIVGNCLCSLVPINRTTSPGGGSSSVFSRQLAPSSLRKSASSKNRDFAMSRAVA